MAGANIPDEALEAAVLGAKQARYEIGQHLNASDGNHGVSADDVFRLEAQRALEAAAPLIVVAELDLILADRERLPYEQWAQLVADRASKRLGELRVGA